MKITDMSVVGEFLRASSLTGAMARNAGIKAGSTQRTLKREEQNGRQIRNSSARRGSQRRTWHVDALLVRE